VDKDIIDSWVKRFKEKHGDRYDYSLFITYINSETPIPIFCSIHGIFNQSPYVHAKGHQCKKCSKESMNLKSLLLRANKFKLNIYEKFGDRISVCLEDYVNDSTLISYKCSNCNQVYKSSPNKLLKDVSTGCAYCYGKGKHIQNEGYFNKYEAKLSQEIGYLYIVRLFDENEDFLKVGITKNENPLIRLEKVPYKKEIIYFEEDNMYNCFTIEQYILKEFSSFKYKPLLYFGGYTECLNIQLLVKIVEEIKYRTKEIHEPSYD